MKLETVNADKQPRTYEVGQVYVLDNTLYYVAEVPASAKVVFKANALGLDGSYSEVGAAIYEGSLVDRNAKRVTKLVVHVE